MVNLSGITLHQVFDWMAAIVVVSSLLNSFLPPYEWFASWPRFQSVYKIVLMTITRWGAINVKSVVYPSIKANGTTQSGGTAT